MTKLKNVVVLDENKLKAIAEGEVKFDNRVNNTGRPVNKKSARQARLAKQAFYANVNDKFVKGNQFEINGNEYKYLPVENGELGCIVNEINGYVCNVSYIGRTKVQGFTYVLGRLIKITINLKEVTFIKK